MSTSSLPEASLTSNLIGFWQQTLDWQRFIRFAAFTFTGVLPLVGAATVSPQPSYQHLMGLVLFAFFFHVYTYVLNDIIDLPVDRINTDRAMYPLVKGTISMYQAIVVTFIQLPLAFGLTYLLEGDWRAYSAALVAFAMLTVYDVWGKLNPFPIMTDFLQGIGWAALVVYGAAIVGETFLPITWCFTIAIVVYVMVINGAHGAMRDVESDLRGNRCTASILLGAQPAGPGRLFIPLRLKIYMFGLKLVVLGLLLYPLLINSFNYSHVVWWITFVLVIGLHAINWWASYLLAQQNSPYGNDALAYTYWATMVFSLAFIVMPYVSLAFSLTLAIVALGPFLTYDYPYGFIRWLWEFAKQPFN